MFVAVRSFLRFSLPIVTFLLLFTLSQICRGQVPTESDAHVVYWDARAKMQRMLWLIEDAVNNPNDINVSNLLPMVPGSQHADIAPYFEGLAARTSKLDLRLDSVETKAGGYEIGVKVADDVALSGSQSEVTIEINPDLSFDSSQQLFAFITELRGIVSREDGGLRERSIPRIAQFSDLEPTDYTSSHLLRPNVLFSNDDLTIGRLTATTSEDELDAIILNRPFAVAGMIYLDPAFPHDLALVSDANWDRIVATDPRTPWLISYGEHGTDAFQFSSPTGLAFTNWRIVVSEAYNSRVSVYRLLNIGGQEPDPVFEYSIEDGFSLPIDVATTEFRCQQDLAGCFESYIAVLDQGNNQVNIYELGDTAASSESTYPNFEIQFQLDNPTSLCYGRNLLTHEGSQLLYVADAGNNRVVAFYTQQPYPAGLSVFETPSGVFPQDAYLSCVATDNNGYVYAMDKANATIYKFTSDLDALIARWGSSGIADGQMYYPNRIGWPRAFKYIDDNGQQDMECQDAGDALVTEFFSDDTGVRRLIQGLDIIATGTEYQPKYPFWDHDYIYIKWWQTDMAAHGFANISGPNGYYASLSIDDASRAGLNYWEKELSGAPDGEYEYNVCMFSPYGTCAATTSGSFMLERYTDDTTSYLGFNCSDCSLTPYDESGEDDCCYVSSSRIYRATVGHAEYIDPDKSLQFKWYGCGTDVTFYHFVDDNLVPYNGVDTVIQTTTLNPATMSVLFKIPNLPPSGSSGDELSIIGCHVDTLYDGQTPTKEDTDTTGATLLFRAPLYYSFCESPCADDRCADIGCPTLHYWQAGGYRFENNILSQSEVDTLPQDYIDRLAVLGAVMARPGEYEFKIAELEEETSYLDRISVTALDVPVGASEALIGSDRDIMLALDTALPMSAKLADGSDVLSLVIADDAMFLADDSAGAIELEYSLGVVPNVKGEVDPPVIPVDPPIKIPYKKADGSIAYNWYRISAMDETDEWVTVAEIYPRQRTATQYVSLGDYMFDGNLKLRIEWSEEFSANFLPAVVGRVIEPDTVDLQFLSATHAVAGDVSNKLLYSDDSRTVLTTDEDIVLCYKTTYDPPDGYERVFFVETEGWYERQEEEKPDPFTAGKQSDDPKFNPNYPNPFNPSTTFSFSLPSPAQVKLEIFNILGQKVSTVVDKQYPAGDHVVHWSTQSPGGESLATGVYLARFSVGDYASTRKLVVLK